MTQTERLGPITLGVAMLLSLRTARFTVNNQIKFVKKNTKIH